LSRGKEELLAPCSVFLLAIFKGEQMHELFFGMTGMTGRYVEAEACAEAGLKLEGTVPVAKGLVDLLTKCQLETKESPEFQKQIHQLRVNKRRDAKMQQLLAGLNMGGMGGVQMFNGMNTVSQTPNSVVNNARCPDQIDFNSEGERARVVSFRWRQESRCF
jgi:hypothetical protein